MKRFLAVPLALLAGGALAQTPLRVYVAGESIERRNRYVASPFTGTGALNDRGGGELRNDNEEYGWSVPLRDRLHLRAPDLTIEFVGADVWADADDAPYTGTYPSAAAEPTSAISGTSIPAWVAQRRAELENRTFCYDIAFASRGGNDFGNDNDTEYKAQLKELVVLLANGSSCETNPIVVVTGHMPDDQGWGGGIDYANLQLHRFAERSRQAVTELAVEQPTLRVRFADQYTPFTLNQPTTAFPSEVWSSSGVPDYAKIARAGDGYHPRRLASIYAGELAADALDLTELRGLTTTCSLTISGPSFLCVGGSVTLDAGPGYAGYSWSTGATTRTITVSPTVTTGYTVSGTDPAGCSALASVHTVTVRPGPDTTPPSVTPPPTVTVDQSLCCGSLGGASAMTNSMLDVFLAGGAAADDCDPLPMRLTPQVLGIDVGYDTCFEAGATTVTFRFQDSSARIGTANSSVLVQMFGDLNADRTVDPSDMVVLRAYFNFAVAPGTPPFGAPLEMADLTHDTAVDPSDMVMLRAYFNFAVACLAP